MPDPGYSVHRLDLNVARVRPGEQVHRGGYCTVSFQEDSAGAIAGANVFAHFGPPERDPVRIGGPETWELDDFASQLWIENSVGAGIMEIVVSPPTGVRREA